jgi:osmotically-inducible protein OsmY
MRTALTLIVALALAPTAWAQEGAAERVGKSLDKAAKSIRRGVENAVDTVMSGVEQKELQTRTYYRIHWDRALNKAVLNLTVREDGAVVLRGSVADAAAKRRAVELARSTVGVTSVIDELVVGKAKPVKVVPGSPETPDRKVPPTKNTEIRPAETP